MTTITENKRFKVTFNGSATFFIIDTNGDCWFATDTKRKALIYFKKVNKCYND